MAASLTHILPRLSVTLAIQLPQGLPSDAEPHANLVLTADLSAVQGAAGDPPPLIDATGNVQLPPDVRMTLPPQPNLGINLWFAHGILNPEDPASVHLKPIPATFVSVPAPVFDPAVTFAAGQSFPLATHSFSYEISSQFSTGTRFGSAFQCAGFMTILNLACNPGGPTISPGGAGTSPCEWSAPGVMRFWTFPRTPGLAGVADYLRNEIQNYIGEGNVPSTRMSELRRELSRKLAYYVADVKAAHAKKSSSSELEQNYTLPDGQVITIDDPRFRAPAVLEKPWLIGLDQDGHPTELSGDDVAGLSSDAEVRRYVADHSALAVTFHDGFVRLIQPL